MGAISDLNLVNTNSNERESLSKDIELLESKINEYLINMSENMTYSVLPLLRYKYPDDDFKTITISKSIKVTRFTSRKLLASKLLESVIKSVKVYDLEGVAISLYLLDRPWLNADEFNVDMSTVTKTLDSQIDADIFSRSRISKLNELNKVKKLKDYKYKNVVMNDYGEPVFNNNNNLIGYKINDNEYASIETYYNNENLYCNKVSILGFDVVNLPLNLKEKSVMTTWIDIKTEFGFIRELDNIKYYYNINNILFNVEVTYNQPNISTTSLFFLFNN